MTNPLSNLGAGTFKGTIKVKKQTVTHSEQKFGASLATYIAHQHSIVPLPKHPPMTNTLSNLGADTFKETIKVEPQGVTHSEQKFGASLATWHCPATLKSPHTKILPYDKSLVKFGRRYF